jgi:2-polyprenyl-3-methyl-5-hydroxy-6-metoxy-1,4-benzoquinol methylase
MGSDPVSASAGVRRENVRRYFQRQAGNYAAGSSRGLWAWMRRLETPTVMALLVPKPGESILDAGSGSGHYTKALVEAGANVTALDIEPTMIEALKQRLHVETILGDLMTIPLEPRFDKIVCAGVLEFVQDPTAVVTNLAKGLRPGGVMVILVLARCLPGLGYWVARRANGIDMPMFSRGALDGLAGAAGLRVQHARRAGYNWVASLTQAS